MRWMAWIAVVMAVGCGGADHAGSAGSHTGIRTVRVQWAPGDGAFKSFPIEPPEPDDDYDVMIQLAGYSGAPDASELVPPYVYSHSPNSIGLQLRVATKNYVDFDVLLLR